MKKEQIKNLEESILLLQQEAKHKFISIGDILHLLPGKGRALVLVFLSLPFCQPLQIPGLSMPFGLSIAVIGARMIFGKYIWLPKRLLGKKFKTNTLQKVAKKTLGVVKKMKRWTYPRISGVCLFPFRHVVNGVIICLLGVFLALPLPIPLSNLTAAWAIFLMAFGMLEDDGLFMILGYLVFLITMVFFVFIALSLKLIF